MNKLRMSQPNKKAAANQGRLASSDFEQEWQDMVNRAATIASPIAYAEVVAIKATPEQAVDIFVCCFKLCLMSEIVIKINRMLGLQ